MLTSSALQLPEKQIGLIARGRRTLVLMRRGDEPGDRPPHTAGDDIELHVSARSLTTWWVSVVRVTDVALGELGDRHARELGRRDLDELRGAWERRYGDDTWDDAARAWLLRVRPVVQPRLLNRTVATTRPYLAEPGLSAHGEPEAVDDWVLEGKKRTAEASERSRLEELIAERRRLPMHERLRLVEQEARQRDVPIGRARRVVLAKLEEMERLVHRPVERTLSADRSDP